jgi:hypothetical protein
MPPGRLACGLRMGRLNCGACRNSKRRGDRGEGAALQKMSSGNCQMKNSCGERRAIQDAL